MRTVRVSIFLFVLILLLPKESNAQDIPTYYYVVIGSFAVESNAEKFAGYVRANRYNATYDFNEERRLSYVYILKTTDKAAAYAQATQLQTDSEFKDTWVFYGTLQRDKDVPVAAPVVNIEEPKQPAILDSVAQATDSSVVITEKPEPVPDSAVAITMPAIPDFDPAMVVKGKLIRFVIESPDGKIIPGAVHHVDYGRGRDIATFESGRYLDILPPNSANNPMTIVCALFGYKEVVHEIDYNKPGDTPGVLRDEHNAWVIPYKLEPLVTGDVSVMYRVAFYKDAVVMLPAAQSELDQLVYMMNANPNYRIKIHGHCNGNNARRIIALGSSKNYFATTGSDERKGSAKDLSRMRAEAVQMYLADHGIDIGRTEIYAWGGLNMLVSETSTSAKLNDRIEIEIMKN